MPDDLDCRDAAGCHHDYRMLGFGATIAPDEDLAVGGDVLTVCKMENLST